MTVSDVRLERAARRLSLDHSLVEAVSALEARGVPSLVLKGPGFAQWLYDDPGERAYGDIDLLVAPGRLDEARSCLASLGYRSADAGLRGTEFATHHEVWRKHREAPATIELHETLFAYEAPSATVWEHLSSDRRALDVRGARLMAPGPAASALIVATHAAQHGVDAAKPMRDLEIALEKVEEAVWHEAVMLAAGCGAIAPFATGLGLRPAGRALLDRLALPACPPPFALRLRAAGAPGAAMGIEQLLTTPGLRRRAALIKHELVPSRAFMTSVYPVARRGPRGLAAAYAWRPLHVALMLPRGALAWFRTRRS